MVELLNFDEYLLSRSIPVRSYDAHITGLESLTHDIRRLEIVTAEPLKFWAGQYADITVPGTGVTRSFSMANPPSRKSRLEFIIKMYPNGAFSSLLNDTLRPLQFRI
ncbi:MAG: hypothetical protein JOZ21_00080 [Verrucomicrobia bacterium]|nr:hypothetical protein [Verrucomicrobiota bacterium]